MFHTLISAPQLQGLQASATPPLVFDCSFELMDPAAGPQQFRQAHLPGARYAHLDQALSAQEGQPSASGAIEFGSTDD